MRKRFTQKTLSPFLVFLLCSLFSLLIRKTLVTLLAKEAEKAKKKKKSVHKNLSSSLLNSIIQKLLSKTKEDQGKKIVGDLLP